MHHELSAERLRELLSYDAETGAFAWRIGRGGLAKSGARAGAIESGGYVQIQVEGRLRMAHRLAWLYVHGRWPTFEIDHMNGVRDDNRLSNLREATRAENQQNERRARSSNKASGLLGVTWCERASRWRAKIMLGGKNKHLGLFDTAEAAHNAYLAAKAEIHPFAPKLAA